MKNALILHGIGGDPTRNWYSYIASSARKRGYDVLVPQLPSSAKPNLDVTYDFLLKKFDFNRETVLIGHSSGASLALGILQKLPKEITINKTILVAGFIDSDLTPELHKYIPRSDYKDLFPTSWDWEKIKKTSSSFVIFHSPLDPFVQVRHPQTMKDKLNAKLILVPNALHFSTSFGGEKFKEFPLLLRYLL